MKRRLFIWLTALLLFVSVSFAWILNDTVQTYKFIEVDYRASAGQSRNILRVAPQSLGVTLCRQDTDAETFVPLEEGQRLELSDMVPNEILPFRIRFENSSGSTLSVSLAMTELETSIPELLDFLYLGVTAGSGFSSQTNADVVTPDQLFLKMTEAEETSLGLELPLYSTLKIPPTAPGEYVELNCYFWLDRNATLELADASFSIGHIRVII